MAGFRMMELEKAVRAVHAFDGRCRQAQSARHPQRELERNIEELKIARAPSKPRAGAGQGQQLPARDIEGVRAEARAGRQRSPPVPLAATCQSKLSQEWTSRSEGPGDDRA
jgi:hypothetical protein